MIKRKLLGCILAFLVSTRSVLASVKNYNPVTDWVPTDDYEFEEDGCVIGFWYNEKTQMIRKAFIAEGFTPFEMNEDERPGSFEDGWNYFTLSKFFAVRNGRVLNQRPSLSEKLIVDKLVIGVNKFYKDYFFIRLIDKY